MKVIGFRCSNSDFTYAVIEGDKESPEVIVAKRIAFPKNFSEGERLRWFRQELNTIFSENNPEVITLKGAEFAVSRSNSLDSRLYNEGVVILVAAEIGILEVAKKVNATMAKDLGLKGKAKYLKTKLDTSPINDFDSYNPKHQEAILAGWSSM